MCDEWGFGDWRTDECDNIRCGVKNMCNAMRKSQDILKGKGDPRSIVIGIHPRYKYTPPWIHGEICRGQQNAIYQPPGVFDDCLKKKYGLVID